MIWAASDVLEHLIDYLGPPGSAEAGGAALRDCRRANRNFKRPFSWTGKVLLGD